MALDPLQRHKLKKILKELDSYSGRHTELVSVYVPEGYDIIKIIQQLAQEQGTATNIKSASTRKNVTDALEKMIQHLRLYTKTPPNGLICFSGNIADQGQNDVRVWSLEPPVPIKLKLYRCDKNFVTEPLHEMLESKELYVLIVMDKREGNIALLKGKAIVPILATTSNVPGKTRAGGQSAQRFERLREGAAKEFFSRLGQHMTDQLIPMSTKIKGIIIGGPGHTKNEFYDGNYITTELKNKVLALKDITYTGEFGFEELIDAAQDVLSEAELGSEKAILQKFFNLLSRNAKLVTYGESYVKKALQMGAVDTLLLSETLEDEKISEFEELAKQFGTSVQIMSAETREGVQLREIGKIGAILRYELDL